MCPAPAAEAYRKQQATQGSHVCPDRATLPAMATVSPDFDLAQLIADTETEILRVVSDRDPSTAGAY
jgi:hypothetical protein